MSTPPTISQVASFVKRAWNPMAALQAVSLGGLGMCLTLSIVPFKHLTLRDYAFPLAVAVYVYWRNGILNQQELGTDDGAQEDDVENRKCPRLGGRSGGCVVGWLGGRQLFLSCFIGRLKEGTHMTKLTPPFPLAAAKSSMSMVPPPLPFLPALKPAPSGTSSLCSRQRASTVVPTFPVSSPPLRTLSVGVALSSP